MRVNIPLYYTVYYKVSSNLKKQGHIHISMHIVIFAEVATPLSGYEKQGCTRNCATTIYTHAFCENRDNCPRLQGANISTPVERNFILLIPQGSHAKNMMTSWHGSTCCINGPLCGESSGHWRVTSGFRSYKICNAVLWCFPVISLNKLLSEQVNYFLFQMPRCSSDVTVMTFRQRN